MRHVLSLIDRMQIALGRYMENQNPQGDADVVAQTRSISDACGTLRAKYEMLAHCVGMLCVLQGGQTEVVEEDRDVKVPVKGGNAHIIRCYGSPLHRMNIICSFHNMLALSASLQDAIVTVIWRLHGKRIEARYANGKSVNAKRLSLPRLAGLLGKQNPLGEVLSDQVDSSSPYGTIIDLRNSLIHRSLSDVLVGDYINRDSVPCIESRWTPTGAKMRVPEYACLVYSESVNLIEKVCDCLTQNPGTCIEDNGSGIHFHISGVDGATEE